MKKILSFILALTMVFSLGVCAFGAEKELTLVDNGTANAYIVLPEKPESYEKYAANVLQKFVAEMTGVTLPVVSELADVAGNRIFIGETDGENFDFNGKKNGSYIIEADGNSLAICGNGNAGTIYGVYRFLEDFCGVHYYTKDVKTVSHEKTLSIPADCRLEYEPYFAARRLDTVSAMNNEFQVANSLNNGVVISKEMGGSIPYYGTFCHSLVNYYCKPADYFEEHPEYYALRDGKRVPDQLCLTNEDVLKIVLDGVLRELKTQHDPTLDLQIVSVTQNDNQNYCQCEKCAALDRENGSQAGTMITFVNQIADAVKEAGYDNVAIDTFAYQYTRKAPTKVVPRDNVLIRLCSIECCFGHKLEDKNCAENAAFMKDLDDWAKLSKRLYIWDYVNNYSETILPFANFGVLQANLQTFYEHNAVGVYEEGNYYQDSCDGEFADLRTYVLSQLMENPYCNYDDAMNRFLEAFYGAGWKNIREYIDIMTAHSVTKNKHLYIRQQPRDALPGLTLKEVTRCDELWENAENMAQNEEYLSRVKRSELCWRHWKCSNYRKEFSIFRSPYKFMKAREDLYNDLVNMGFLRVGEGDIKVLTKIPVLYLTLPCDYWESKHENGFWTFISPFIESLYVVVTNIHDFFHR